MRALAKVPPADTAPSASNARLAHLVAEHLGFIWRVLRRVGLSPANADDAAQQVFLVAARRIEQIEPGRERAFLYQIALYTASKSKRTVQRRREDLGEIPELEELGTLSPEELLDLRKAREVLDALLAGMPDSLRAVFILHQVEGFSLQEIAVTLGVPAGTAASRLRRARVDFQARVARLEARFRFRQKGGEP